MCTGSILAFLAPPVTHGATSKAAIPPLPECTVLTNMTLLLVVKWHSHMHTWLLFNQRLFHWMLVFKQRPNSSPCLYGLLDQELLQVWHLSWCPTNNTKPLNEQKYNTNRHTITGRSRRWSWMATPLSFPPFLPSLLPSPSFTSLLRLLHPSIPSYPFLVFLSPPL